MPFKIDPCNIRDMKILVTFTIFLFALSNCIGIEKQPDKKSQKIIQKKNKSKTVIKKTKTKIKKTVNRNTRKRLLAKEALLPKNHYKSKKSKKELETEFEKHLENIKQTCEIKDDKKKFLQKQLNFFNNFLNISSQDPNMDYTLHLLFSDIINTLKETNYNDFISLDTFTLFYRMLYKLPEDIEIVNYPDNWAKTIAQSIECAQQEKKRSQL